MVVVGLWLNENERMEEQLLMRTMCNWWLWEKDKNSEDYVQNLKDVDKGFLLLEAELKKTKFDMKGCKDKFDNISISKGW